MKDLFVDGVIKLLEDSRFLKEIGYVNDYQKYLQSSYYKNDLSEVLNQLVYAIDFRDQSFIHLSENVNEVFGLSYKEVVEKGPMSIYDYILPQDNDLLDRKILKKIIDVALQEKDHEPENLRFAYNFRMKTPMGGLRCILQ